MVAARLAPDAPEVILTAEDLPLFAAAYPGFRVSRADANTPDVSGSVEMEESRLALPDGGPDPEAARAEIVRRALATAPPITSLELTASLRLERSEVERILASLESQGAVFRGHFTTRAPVDVADSHDDDAASDSTLQWCDRYVLERIHRNTLTLLRAEVEPCSDHEFTSFRLRWQHLDDTEAPRGLDGVRAIIQQLCGLGFVPDFWERAILPARSPDYRPEYLDLLCMSGEIAWIAAPRPDQPDNGASAFPQLVAFAPRGGGFAPATRSLREDDAHAQAVAQALAVHGALHLDQLADRAGVSERDTLSALWRLAAAGMVSNDCFAPLRLLWSDPDAKHQLDPARMKHGALTRHDAALRARLKSSVSGRWSLVEPKADPASRGVRDASERVASVDDRARDLGDILLKRHGVLTREMMALEQFDISWRDLAFVLRRMEYSGLIRRGWFVRSLSGEQYALPEALEMLRATRLANPGSNRPIALSAADPANPYGVLLPGCGVPREPGNLLVMQSGRVVMALAGKSLLTPEPLDSEQFSAALAALMRIRPKLAVETIDGSPALESDRVPAMAAAQFHSDGRSLIYDGLPGPAPARTTVAGGEAALR